jgi:hypothetical protein
MSRALLAHPKGVIQKRHFVYWLRVNCIFARFVIPNCCVSLVQFFFGVLLLVYLLCPLGNGKLNVLLTVHRSISVQ